MDDREQDDRLTLLPRESDSVERSARLATIPAGRHHVSSCHDQDVPHHRRRATVLRVVGVVNFRGDLVPLREFLDLCIETPGPTVNPNGVRMSYLQRLKRVFSSQPISVPRET